tara:strand:+ start:620 stop:1564 length:945 start_codon:yes stop_codon:yes gene_type:complete
MIFLSLSLRLTGLDNFEQGSDFDSYIYNMKLDGVYATYHLREFIFWFGIRYIYQIFGDPFYVFFILDIILFLVFYKAVNLSKNLFSYQIEFKNLKYLFFLAFLFFPFFLGMSNAYRGIFALPFVLLSLGYIKKKPIRGYLIFFLSLFIHNSSVFLFPILLLLRSKSQLKIIPWASIFILLFFISQIDTFTNSFLVRAEAVEIGDRISSIYLSILIFILFFIIFLEMLVKEKGNEQFVYLFTYFFFVYLTFYLFSSGQQVERTFFLIMSILFIPLGIYLENKLKPNYLVRLIYLTFVLSPLAIIWPDSIFKIILI